MPADNPEMNAIRDMLKVVLIEIRDQLAAQNITLNLAAIRKKVDEN